MKYGFIYKWISMTDGKIYIGSHFGHIDDGYISSSKYFNEIYAKCPNNFYREIIKTNLSREDAILLEQKMLCDIDAANSVQYYNLHNYSGKGWTHHDNPELAKIYYSRISESKKGKQSPHKGKTLWGEHNRYKLKIDKWAVTDPSGNSFEIENMLKFCKEHNLNPSAMSAVARGARRHYKNYFCKKLTNRRNVKYSYTEWQSKPRTNKPLCGGDNPASKSIQINGVYYGSVTEASMATGLSSYKLRKLRDVNGK